MLSVDTVLKVRVTVYRVRISHFFFSGSPRFENPRFKKKCIFVQTLVYTTSIRTHSEGTRPWPKLNLGWQCVPELVSKYQWKVYESLVDDLRYSTRFRFHAFPFVCVGIGTPRHLLTPLSLQSYHCHVSLVIEGFPYLPFWKGPVLWRGKWYRYGGWREDFCLVQEPESLVRRSREIGVVRHTLIWIIGWTFLVLKEVLTRLTSTAPFEGRDEWETRYLRSIPSFLTPVEVNCYSVSVTEDCRGSGSCSGGVPVEVGLGKT